MGAVIHNVMVLLSCGLVCTLPPFFRCFRFPPAFPTQHSPSIFSAVAVFGVEQFGIILLLAPFSRLGSYVLYWIMISEFGCGCLYVFHFVGQRLFQLRVRSAKWADSPRASSQVNGRSSPYYDISSLSQSLRMFLPRRLLSGSNFIVFTIIRI